jgi:uncharacterized repeat protein (TIGR01451 family)
MESRRRLGVLVLALGALLAIVLASRSARAAGPWYVAPGGDDVLNDCLGAGSPCATINGAIGKASAGDTIYVAVGTYTSTENEVVLIDKDITLSGGWDASFGVQDGTSTVDGEESRRGIVVNNGVTAVIGRFTVQNGASTNRGGGIYNNGGTLTLDNSTVTGNAVNRSVIQVFGGGIYSSSTLTMTSCTVSGNATTYSGGGIYHRDGTLTMSNCTIYDNTARDGGGINNGGTLILNNSTVSGNRADQLGGGIASGGTLTLHSSTVGDNRADIGGGIYAGGGSATVQNTILAGNLGDGPDCSGALGSLGYNLIGDTLGCTFSPASGDLVDISAGLGQLIGVPGDPRYHPLLPGSAAIDAGNPAGCTGSAGLLTTDQRGAARVGRCDMGAYEYTTPGPAAKITAIGGTPQRTPPLIAFELPFQSAVLDNIGSPVHNVTVTFSAPATGASGAFAEGGTLTTTAVTNVSGVATAATFTANGLGGDYAVTATVGGVITPANFLLSNFGWYVSPSGSDGDDCQTPTTPCATITGPFGKTGFAAGDAVLVASGTYTGTGNEVVLLDRSVRLLGGWNSSFTVQNGTSAIDGEESRRCVVVDDISTAVIENFNIQRGDGADDYGGGINNLGTLTLSHSTVTGSSARYGAGVYNHGTLTLDSSTIQSNTFTYGSDFGRGGGIYNQGTMTLDSSIVEGNAAAWGGGIDNRGTLDLDDSIIRDNTAHDYGAGVYNGGTLSIKNSAISSNTGPLPYPGGGGGGIANAGTLTLDNSTVSGNVSRGGGGISNSGTMTLSSSTVTGNRAVTGGGGISTGESPAKLQNTILAGNLGGTPDCSGNIESLGYNLIGISSGCIFTPTVGDLTFVDPGLGPLIGSPGYHPLWPNSLAVDAGNPAGCTDHLGNPLSTDQRGAARVGRCDIGAYEYTPPGSAVRVSAIGGTPQRTPPLTAFGAPLQALLLDSIGSPVHDATVTFYAPPSGVGGMFVDSGTFTTTAVTDGGGIATAATFTANGLTGEYTVTATVAGVVTQTSFMLGNAGWYVAPGGSDTNDCQSPTMPCATINGAHAKTNFVAGDTVLVASGVYVGTGDEVVLLDKSARLLGGWDGAFTAQSGVSAIDGERSRRCMAVGAGVTAHIERFVLQNAFAGGGGGVYNEGVLTLIDITIRDNSSCFGAGLYNWETLTAINITISGNVCEDDFIPYAVVNNSSGVMTLEDAVVSDNALLGVWNYGMLTMTNSTVRGNWNEREPGSVSNWGGILFIDHCTISDNTAGGVGGIVVGSDSTAIVQNSTVSGNTARSGCGGGVSVGSGALTMVNTTISGNTATSGGGICSEGGTLTLNNSTVSGNTATGNEGSGGGIYNDQGTVTLRDSILAGNATANTGPDCSGAVGSAGYNLVGDVSGCSFSSATGDQVGADPKLGPLAGSPGYHPLLGSSPAIDAGNPSGCIDHVGDPLVTDQRGMPRVGRCDIGAYEASLVADKQVVGTYAPGAQLDYTIVLHNKADSDITGVTVTDTLPSALTYVPGSFSATGGTGGESGDVVTWTGTVAAGSGVTITFDATVDSGIPPCSAITNRATIGGQGYQVERQVTGRAPCGACNLAKHAGNPVLSVGASGSWDGDDVWGPAVLEDGGAYAMWYSGHDGSNPSRIGLATSSDGVNWIKSASNPVLSPTESWEANGIQVGSVVLDGGVYEMWYTGYDSSWVGGIGYATSADGVAWVKHDGNPVLDVGAPGSWESGDVMAPTVIVEGSTYYMWYTGRDDTASRIGHAHSGDGVAWVRDPNNPVVDIGAPGAWDWLDVYGPSVVKVGGEHMLWYSGETLPQAWQTGYVTSTYSGGWGQSQMVIPEGPPGAFDTYSADHASIVVESTGYRIWYSGHDGTRYTIGYATADLCSESAAVLPDYHVVYVPVVMGNCNMEHSCSAYYVDHFGDPTSGWPVADYSDRRYAYVGGEYQIWVKQPSQGWLVTPGAMATDFAAAVSVRRASGSGAYGIVFAINEDWSEYYEFLIGMCRNEFGQVTWHPTCYSVWRHEHHISTGYGTQYGYVHGGSNWNRMMVVWEGRDISIYINGHLVTTMNEDDFSGLRRIGLVAHAHPGSPLDARFDDFMLYPASCGVGAATAGFEMGEPDTHGARVLPELQELP